MQTATAEVSVPEQLSPEDFLTIHQVIERYPNIWPHMNAARWAIRCRDKNGLSDYGVLTRKGGKFIVCVPRLVDWLANHSDA